MYRQPESGRVRLLVAQAVNRYTASFKLPRQITEQGIKFTRQGGIKIYTPEEPEK
jgi:hypothetical protein